MRQCIWRNGPPSQHFLNQRIDVWQTYFVRRVGKTVLANYCIELRLRFMLNLREQDHGKEEKR